VLIAGGVGADGQIVPDVERFIPRRGSFQSIGGTATMSILSRASAIFIVAVACAATGIVGCRRPQIVSRVDTQSIRSIKIGMSEREVTAILGQPLQIRP
jgi:hypothetical protein